MVRLLRTIAINLLLIAAFCALVVVLIRPLEAELAFQTGERLAAHFKWAEAGKKFLDATKLDPFNSRYLGGLGDFLFLQARYGGNNKGLLKRAKGLYEKAAELDPRNAEYWLKLGLIEMGGKGYSEAFGYFRKAAENDPNGFNVAYSIGYAGLDAWKKISDADRAFAIDRLRTAMAARPTFDIYLKAWVVKKDIELLRAFTPDSLDGQRLLYGFIVSRDLWQFRKEQAGRVEQYLKKEAPDAASAGNAAKAKRIKEVRGKYESGAGAGGAISAADWQGSSPDGKYKYENGNMYWSGTMDAAIKLPQGSAVIKIRARGQPLGKIYPYMIVELDGKEIGETFVDSAEWKEYSFDADTDGGIGILSVTFANDAGNEKEDRNLFVEDAEVEVKK